MRNSEEVMKMYNFEKCLGLLCFKNTFMKLSKKMKIEQFLAEFQWNEEEISETFFKIKKNLEEI